MMSMMSYLHDVIREDVINNGERPLTNLMLLQAINAANKKQAEDQQLIEDSMPFPDH